MHHGRKLEISPFASWSGRVNISVCLCVSPYERECVMGIHCLLPFLRKYGKNVNVKEFSGQIAAVDASCWLHKGLSASLARSGRRDRWDIFTVVSLYHENAAPLFITLSNCSFYFFVVLFFKVVLIYSIIFWESWSKRVSRRLWCSTVYLYPPKKVRVKRDEGENILDRVICNSASV